ncbi:MAG: phage tail assembly chaperone [Myxococcota bacterium]
MPADTTKVIDGLEFEIAPLPALRAFSTLPRIVALFAPITDNFSGAETDVAAIARALGALMRTKPEELTALLKILLEGATVMHEGKRVTLLPVFDVVMHRKVLTAYKLLIFAVEVNYTDFFAELEARLGGLRAKLAAKISPPTSSPSGPAIG